ncbi:hypothetical protein ABZ511_11300 [Nocardia gamkensis]|uniref:hypothetical protein n=1 Tax=Nocardia TaxID=1817 RepID=UPI0033FA5457
MIGGRYGRAVHTVWIADASFGDRLGTLVSIATVIGIVLLLGVVALVAFLVLAEYGHIIISYAGGIGLLALAIGYLTNSDIVMGIGGIGIAVAVVVLILFGWLDP